MISNKLIQKLKDAGVGSDIILNLILQPEEEEQPAAPAEPAAAPEEPKKPEAAAMPAGDPIMEKIDKLIGVIQASNIIRDGRDAAPKESVDDILAAMIAPPKKGGNNGT